MILIIILAVFLSSYFGGLIVCQHAERLNLIQVPNYRSSHKKPTPHGGGLAIVFSFCAISAWLLWQQELGYALFLIVTALALIIALISLLDDLFYISRFIRISIHLVASLILILGLSNLALYSELNFFGLPFWLIVTGFIFISTWWINLFNFMDGIDGIAATQAIFMLLAAAGLSLVINPEIYQETLWLWMLYLVAAIAGFLILNWSPAKLFMGDVGSTFIAFMLVFFALSSIYLNWLNYAVWGILAALFVTDASFTLIRRIITRQAWREAHCSHAYQRLAHRWQSHQKVTLLYLGINLFWLLPLAYLALQPTQNANLYLAIAYTPLIISLFILNKVLK